MNNVMLFVFFSGVVLLILNELVKSRTNVRVEYRYLPRDLDTYLREQPYPSIAYKDMFQNASALHFRDLRGSA